ncbi:SDR family NAD(P)-dependent oxidoreductase [Spirillospora sp. NBC_01491]|uniref:SDR family NAD(P)-dependent oxidoreductase n=1 Tax=Spirillospora sp. NBC_01491 TaxID=2976007 RepID=UPI002E3204BD|nr:SDR family NAD(P)-dependent oxidoreductase [Spirillospora sp. NBC_01491]
MRTLVISGGTDGIGRALALASVRRGDTVAVIGRSEDRGRAFLRAAAGASGRAHFVRADLSLLSENERVVEEVTARFPVVDALVLCARHYRSARAVTAEGFEANYALFYLSRFLLGHGLVGPLEKAGAPVVVNVAGPGAGLSALRWDDLGLERGYHGAVALAQGGPLNDLLGVAFAAEHGTGPIRYVLVHPGTTATGFSGEYDAETAALIARMRRSGKPVAEAVAPIAAVIDAPPREPLSAFVEGVRIPVDGASFDRAAAARLQDLTRRQLRLRASGGHGA